jgi:hypothetical protein
MVHDLLPPANRLFMKLFGGAIACAGAPLGLGGFLVPVGALLGG